MSLGHLQSIAKVAIVMYMFHSLFVFYVCIFATIEFLFVFNLAGGTSERARQFCSLSTSNANWQLVCEQFVWLKIGELIVIAVDGTWTRIAYTVNDSRWWFCIGFPNWTMIHTRLTHGLLATTNTRFGYEMDTVQFKLWMRNKSNWIWWIFWCTEITQNAADACIASPKQTKSIFWHFFYCLQRMFSKCLARSECVQWCHYVDVNAYRRWMW